MDYIAWFLWGLNGVSIAMMIAGMPIAISVMVSEGILDRKVPRRKT